MAGRAIRWSRSGRVIRDAKAMEFAWNRSARPGLMTPDPFL